MNPLVLTISIRYKVYNKQRQRYQNGESELKINADQYDVFAYMERIKEHVEEQIPKRFSFIHDELDPSDYRIGACKVTSAKRKPPKK